MTTPNDLHALNFDGSTDYDGKFIVIKVTSPDGGERLLVRIRTRDHMELHKHIFEHFLGELRRTPFTAECVGGGKLTVVAAKKIVILEGASEKYGQEPNRTATEAVITRALPGFTTVLA